MAPEGSPAGRTLLPLSKAKRRLFGDLGTRSGRERHGLFLLEGPRAIEDALARGVDLGWIVVDPAGAVVVEGWRAAGLLRPTTEVREVTAGDLAAIADTTTPQGIVAVGTIPRASLVDRSAPTARVTLLLDGLQDPGNLGTLLRTLAGAGGGLALSLKGTVDAWNPKALRAAAGATFAVDVVGGLEPAAALDWLAAREIPLVALEVGGQDLVGADLPAGPLALAVGNEAAGLSEPVRRAARVTVGLPLAAVESLSAPVAGSIALYLLTHGSRRNGA